MIDIQHITKSFGTLQVLKGIDLHIDKGEVVSIVGPSGAGKTTLLQIIGTLDRPDSGTVVVDGIDTSRLSTKKLSDFRNRHLGFVFQFHQLLPEFTAIENIMIPAYIAGLSNRQARQRAEEGKKIGFIGIVTPLTLSKTYLLSLRDEKGDTIYDFLSGNNAQDLYDAVQNYINELKNEKKVNYIFLLTHLRMQLRIIPVMGFSPNLKVLMLYLMDILI